MKRSISIRSEPDTRDVGRALELLNSTGVFHQREIAVAGELIEDRLEKGLKSEYSFLFAENPASGHGDTPAEVSMSGNSMYGFICYGPITVTESSFDIYWIATAKGSQRRGIGGLLLGEAERLIAGRGGKKAYVETSSTADYAPAVAFYARHGYHVAARVPDYYADGDDRLILMKRLAR